MKLSDAKLRALKPRATPYRVFDGHGLYVEVSPSGGRLWRWKFRRAGKEGRLAFGAYPDVSLAHARGLCEAARHELAEGRDPGEVRRAARAAEGDRAGTFEVIALEWLAKFGQGLAAATRKANTDRLKRLVYPTLGPMPIAAIKPLDVLAMLRPIEARGTVETAHRVRHVVGQVMRYAVATGRAERDVTTDLRGALPPTQVRHMAAITDPVAVAPLLRALDGYEGGAIVRCALRLAPLVFVRPGELRAAEWAEFDEAAAEWNIPGAKMKMRTPHLVPLSRQTLAVLAELRPLTGAGRYLFPSARSAARPMSNMAINAALRRMGYGRDELTGHGFRAMARTILDETLGFAPHIVEHQLAHAVKDPLGRAYNRTSHLPERRAMMQRWGDYLDGLKSTNVLPFPIAKSA